MLFFKPLRYFNMCKVNGTGKIEFNKGEVYFVEELRNGNLDSYCDSYCDNNSVQAKAFWLKKRVYIEISLVPDNYCLKDLINQKILARMSNV